VTQSHDRSGRPSPARLTHRSAAVHLLLAGLTGAAVGTVVGLVGSWGTGLLAAWVAAAAAFLTLTWLRLWPMDGGQTATAAQREDPGAPVRDVLLLAVAGVSIFAVAGAIIPSGRSEWPTVALGVVSVAMSWVVFHTIFTLRYARAYYSEPAGGIDFNSEADPDYRDFAYLAFTVGMTFQVSDTAISSRDIRASVLRQGLVSFMFLTIIIAISINVVAGLGSSG
jgi:uncharacterized membrane protein